MPLPSLTEIKNRRDFADAFNIAMAGADQSLHSIWQQFGKDQNLPKSYLIEFHPKDNIHSEADWTAEDLFSTLTKNGDRIGVTVRRTDDESLLYLSHNERAHSAEFIVDALNPRFLAFHTLSNAKETDRFMLGRLSQYQREFDCFWLPVSVLESVEQREQVTGWEASFEPLLDGVQFRSEREDSDDEEIDSRFPELLEALDDEVPVSIPHHTSLRINILRRNAMKAYGELRQARILPDIPLSSILAERFDNELCTQARARIKWNGKVTGRGTDFLSYLQIVNGTLDNYAGIVTSLESQYWLGLDHAEQEPSTGFRLKGEPFCIKFESDINVESVMVGMFNCRPPFRLMGEPEKLSDNYYVVDAVDLHVGQPLAIEISPRLIRIYLYNGTCGNTIARILRSLQHYIDSNLSHPTLQS